MESITEKRKKLSDLLYTNKSIQESISGLKTISTQDLVDLLIARFINLFTDSVHLYEKSPNFLVNTFVSYSMGFIDGTHTISKGIIGASAKSMLMNGIESMFPPPTRE